MENLFSSNEKIKTMLRASFFGRLLCCWIWVISFSSLGCKGGQTIVAPNPSNPLAGCRQMLLISSPFWGSSKGTLQLFERSLGGGNWLRIGPPCKVFLSPNGLGWGSGLHGKPGVRTPIYSKENGRIPAGVFRVMGVCMSIHPCLTGEYRIRILTGARCKKRPRLLFGLAPFSLVGSENWGIPLSIQSSHLKSIALWLDARLCPAIVLLPKSAKSAWEKWGIPGG